ncbi:MAG TPA: hypothetical protein VJV04_16405 [Nitrospiraceae bacterium]|nr:hypothetical protein [Nitrospiraceae bacterium]
MVVAFSQSLGKSTSGAGQVEVKAEKQMEVEHEQARISPFNPSLSLAYFI